MNIKVSYYYVVAIATSCLNSLMHTTRQAQAFVRARASDGHLVAKKGVESTAFSKAAYFSKYPRKLLSLTVDTNLQLEAKNPGFFFLFFFYHQSIKEEIQSAGYVRPRSK